MDSKIPQHIFEIKDVCFFEEDFGSAKAGETCFVVSKISDGWITNKVVVVSHMKKRKINLMLVPTRKLSFTGLDLIPEPGLILRGGEIIFTSEIKRKRGRPRKHVLQG